jgi:hypothetical protein
MLAVDAYGRSAPVIRPGRTTLLSVGPNAVVSRTLPAFLARLVATCDCHIAFGTDPVATASDCLLRAGVTEYFALARADRISVMHPTSTGTLYITEASEF